MNRLMLITLLCLISSVSSATPDFAQTKARAVQGIASAQYNLGIMYDLGDGIPKDQAEAAKWYRKAAEQGYAEAQYNLGVKYRRGEGVPQDYAEAAKWYREAAEQGNTGAQCNLGVLYSKGNGVSQDFTEAYVWSTIAEGSGHEDARQNRDYASSKLAPEDLLAAKERAAKLSAEIQRRKMLKAGTFMETSI